MKETYTYPDDKKKAEGPQPLTGKYVKLRDDLITARKAGLDRAAKVDDGGTCNLDAPTLELPRWQKKKIEQACKEAGCGCFVWMPGVYVISLRCPGMANKRTEAAEAATKSLESAGYNALMYYRVD